MIAYLADTQAAGALERSLVFLGGGELWLDLSVWLFGLFIVLLTIRNHRQLEPRARRWGMIALRTLLVGVLILLYYQPAFLEQKVATNRNSVLVLRDTSESMGLKHGTTSRFEQAKAWLSAQSSFFKGLEDSRDVHQLDFAELLSERVEEASPTGQQTRLVEALRGVRERFRNQDIGGVIIVSDGVDTSPEGRRATPSPELEDILRAIDAPVNAVLPARDQRLKDIAVSHLSSNTFAFLLNASALEATIEVHGYPQGQLLVQLLENGEELSHQTLTLTPTETHYKVRFEFVPKRLGKQVYTVSIEPQPDEIYAKNNQRSSIVQVVRDKLRAVQVVGQPSWDERHMRNLLKEDPNVDLVSFFILVNRYNSRYIPARETSLIPFPVDELFSEQLGGFDVLVMQNFEYGPYNMRQYLPYIAEFVHQGGALVMIGGPLSFSEGGYYGTEVGDILPVELSSPYPPGSTLNTETFQPRLTESGQHHPIMRLSLDPLSNSQLWSQIYPLEGLNMSAGLREGALSLLDHPSLRDRKGRPQPVVAVHEVGKGRVMSVMTDSTWFWNFKAGNRGEDASHYETFWDNAIRWLIRDPQLDLLKVRALREQLSVGEQSELLISALLPDYRPAARQKVSAVVRKRPSGSAPGEGEVVAQWDLLETDANGELRVSFPVKEEGIYEIQARADIVAGRETVATDLFVAVDRNPELERVISDGRLMNAIAERTGGAVLAFEEDAKRLALEEPTVMRIKSRSHDELWSAPWALALVVGLFALEWWLRRRYGYL